MFEVTIRLAGATAKREAPMHGDQAAGRNAIQKGGADEKIVAPPFL